MYARRSSIGELRLDLAIHYFTTFIGCLCFLTSVWIIWVISTYGDASALLCIYPWLAAFGSVWFTRRQLGYIQDIQYHLSHAKNVRDIRLKKITRGEVYPWW
jgi:hypothetical protein